MAFEIAELKGEITELKGEITELKEKIRQYEGWLIDARVNDRDLVVIYADLISKLLDLIKLKEESFKRKEESLILLQQQQARQLLTQQQMQGAQGNYARNTAPTSAAPAPVVSSSTSTSSTNISGKYFHVVGSCFNIVCIAPPLYAISIRLVEVNGKLTSLSEHKGFRKFVRESAEIVGVTGTIQRYHHNDVKIFFEGPMDAAARFQAYLRHWQQQGMFQTFADYEPKQAVFPLFNSFSIIQDHSRTVERGGTVIKGIYSDGEEFDKFSTYSANSQVLQGSQLSHI
jgi:acylphosphatase